MSEPLVEVTSLVKHYRQGGWLRSKAAPVRAVDGVSLAIGPGETLGLVGESGSGKSTLGRLVLRLEEPTSGTVQFEGRDLGSLSPSELRTARQRMQIVFQDPYSSLNPRKTIGRSIADGLEIHEIVPRNAVAERVVELLGEVGLDPDHVTKYPHEFSGGQRQRVGIARALAVEPSLIVCDEPVSALDVSIQAQVLNLLMELRERRRLAYLFIAHDLAVVRHIADRIAVMYLGTVVESGPAKAVIDNPQHPYTQALVSAIPSTNPDLREGRIVLGGEPPSPSDPPPGCPFEPRCFHPDKDKLCIEQRPQLSRGKHEVACHHV